MLRPDSEHEDKEADDHIAFENNASWFLSGMIVMLVMTGIIDAIN